MGALVLNFHGIGTPPAAAPPDEAETWMETDRFRRVLDRAALDARIRLTFDDGYASDRTIALEELRQRGMQATFFLVVSEIGAPGRVSVDDVEAIVDAGMSVGSHGIHHVPWRGLDADRLSAELRDSRAALEDLTGRPVDAAACPFGAYDRRVLRSLRRAGYRRVFTSDGGTADPEAWLQPRTSMRSWDDAAAIDRALAAPLRERIRRRAASAAKALR